MPQLSVLEQEAVELPLTRPQLLVEVEEAARGRSPGLDGLPYEFYAAVLPLIGNHQVEALNVMLEEGEMGEGKRWGGGGVDPTSSRGLLSWRCNRGHIYSESHTHILTSEYTTLCHRLTMYTTRYAVLCWI